MTKTETIAKALYEVAISWQAGIGHEHRRLWDELADSERAAYIGDAKEFETKTDAAGYQIVEKMPPNTVVLVTTDEQGCIVRFEQKGETFSFDPAKP